MLKLKECEKNDMPKELQELVDNVNFSCRGKPNDFVVSAMLTILANAINSEEEANQLLILKGITDFIITMGARIGLKDMPEGFESEMMHSSNENDAPETKAANVDGDSECEDCDECTGKGCIDKGK